MAKIYNIKIGLLFGLLMGIIDVIPMIIQKLSFDADLSALTMWIIAGFFVATSSLNMNGVIKGILISFLTFIPVGILIAAQEPFSLLPITIMLIILGSALGYLIGKYKVA
jgi:hypothetical protein